MGFSGGGSNVLKPHTHDGNIAQDGGALDMDGVTQGSLTAGDLIYSDGSNLQRLAIGGSGQSLTSSGSAPQWSAASGAAMELIETRVISGSTSLSETFTFSPALQPGVTGLSEIYWIITGAASNSDLRMFVNGITTSTYDRQELRQVGATISGVSNSGAPEWALMDAGIYADYFTSQGSIWLAENNTTYKIMGTSIQTGNDGKYLVNFEQSTAGQTNISELKWDAGGGSNAFQIGTRFSLYRYNV
jgi:hypothetical protein